MSPEELQRSLLIVGALWAAYSDLRSRRLSNWVLLLWALSGIPLVIVQDELGSSCIGALVGGLLILPFHLVRGMAAGDVKLMTVIGFLSGWPLILLFVWLSFLFQGLIAGICVLRLRMTQCRWRGVGLPFAPSVVLSVLCYQFYLGLGS